MTQDSGELPDLERRDPETVVRQLIVRIQRVEDIGTFNRFVVPPKGPFSMLMQAARRKVPPEDREDDHYVPGVLLTLTELVPVRTRRCFLAIDRPTHVVPMIWMLQKAPVTHVTILSSEDDVRMGFSSGE